MHSALLELTIEGIDSSRDFHLRVMEDADFRRGDIEIQWLERRLESLTHVVPPVETTRRAAIVAALIAERDRLAPKRAAASAPTGSSTPASSTVGGHPAGDAWLRVARQEALR
jgi:acetyl-CoA carboxylase biotin carboxylase subunit